MHVFPHALPVVQILQHPCCAIAALGVVMPIETRNAGLRAGDSYEISEEPVAVVAPPGAASDDAARPLISIAAVRIASTFIMSETPFRLVIDASCLGGQMMIPAAAAESVVRHRCTADGGKCDTLLARACETKRYFLPEATRAAVRSCRRE
jgi:hypothetical protein